MAEICPCCKRRLPTPKVQVPVDTAAMTDAQLIAHCKKIGLREDVRFFLRVAGPIRAGLKREAEALLAQLEQRNSTKADADQLNRIRDAYRVDRLTIRHIEPLVREASAVAARARLRTVELSAAMAV